MTVTKKLYKKSKIKNKVNVLEGTKLDSGKLQYDLIPVKALREIVRVLNFGAKKYAARNWEKGITYNRVYAALQRHITSWWEGEDRDLETGISHLAHAGCCLLFLLHFSLYKKYIHLDNRPIYT